MRRVDYEPKDCGDYRYTQVNSSCGAFERNHPISMRCPKCCHSFFISAITCRVDLHEDGTFSVAPVNCIVCHWHAHIRRSEIIYEVG